MTDILGNYQVYMLEQENMPHRVTDRYDWAISAPDGYVILSAGLLQNDAYPLHYLSWPASETQWAFSFDGPPSSIEGQNLTFSMVIAQKISTLDVTVN